MDETIIRFFQKEQFSRFLKLTQFSMNLVTMMTKKQDGHHGSSRYVQRRYLKNYYTFTSETNFTFRCHEEPNQPTKINDIVQIFVISGVAITFSSHKQLK